MGDAADDGGSVVDSDVGAHAFEFGAVHEALGEDGVLDDADAWGGGEECCHLGLHVGGVAGVGGGDEVDALEVFAAVDGAGVSGVVEGDGVSGFDDGGGDGFEVFAVDAAEGDAIAGEGGGGHEGSGFDAVGDDGVFDGVELFDAFDGDAAGSSALDFGSHGVEEVGEVEDFGFCGGGFDDGDAIGEGGGHHDVVGAEDGGAVGSAEVDFRAAEAIGGGEDDVSAFEFDFCAEGLEAAEVEVYGAVADDAAAGE